MISKTKPKNGKEVSAKQLAGRPTQKICKSLESLLDRTTASPRVIRHLGAGLAEAQTDGSPGRLEAGRAGLRWLVTDIWVRYLSEKHQHMAH